MLRPRWKRTATVLSLVAVLVGVTLALGATSATAQEVTQHGISFTKGCTSPTAIGQAYSCSYSIRNNVDDAQDTLTINGLTDVVHSAGGDVNSGNVFGSLQLIGTLGTPSCPGATGTGTALDPWRAPGLTSCTLPFGSRIFVQSFSHYTVQAADFALPGHVLADTASLNWADTVRRPGGHGEHELQPEPA